MSLTLGGLDVNNSILDLSETQLGEPITGGEVKCSLVACIGCGWG